MPRTARDSQPGIFHVSTHSVWTGVLFRDDIDRMHFVTELSKTVSKLGWSCMAVSLLTTHYHLLIETFDSSLSHGMKRLNLAHATRFNARHKLRGHVVDGRFWSDRVQSEPHLLAVFRYIALNAAEAGICGAPAEWPWCSYRALVEPVESFTFVDVSRVLGCWGPGAANVTDLRRFVETPWLTGPGV
jgi:putative transposase